MRGKHKWIPPNLIQVLDNVKLNYNIPKDNDGFKKIAELSNIGLEVDKMRTKLVLGDIFMNKKKRSNLMDVGTAAILLFILGIVLIISNYTYNTYVEKVTNITQVNSSSATTTALNNAKTVINNRFDMFSFALLIGFALSIIITGWYVGNNPLFIFIYLLGLVVFIIVSSVLSFTWHKITIISAFTKTMTYFPITNHILNYLAIYVTLIAFLGLIVSFAKSYIGDSGGGG